MAHWQLLLMLKVALAISTSAVLIAIAAVIRDTAWWKRQRPSKLKREDC